MRKSSALSWKSCFTACVLLATFIPLIAQSETLPPTPTGKNSQISSETLSHLSQLLSDLNIPHKKDFDSMVEATQRWRRKPDQERWEVPELNLDSHQKQRVLSHLEKMGLIKELKPESNDFDYAFVLGATVPRMKARLNQLINQWNEGVRFHKIIFLSGQRPLTDDIDRTDELVNESVGRNATEDQKKKIRPHTEVEAARLLYQSTDMPEAMLKVDTQFISSPRYLVDGRWERGNTRDNIKYWLQMKPEPGKVLVISNQPHAFYQQEVIRQELPPEFITEVSAQKAQDNARFILTLDALALWLHNLQKRVNMQHQHTQ